MAENSKQNMLVEIYREIGETKTAVKNVEKKLDSHIDYSLEELKKINELDTEQNRILDIHVEGVNTLKDMHTAHRQETGKQIELLQESLNLQKEEHDVRIRALEKPYDLVKLSGKILAWAVGIAGGIAAVLRIMGL